MKIESQFVIKNCPFCGGQGKLYKINSEAYVVRCENPACKAEQIIFASEEAAVQMWNRRAVTSEIPRKYLNEVLDELKSEVINIADGKRSLTVNVVLRIISKTRAYFWDKSEDEE